MTGEGIVEELEILEAMEEALDSRFDELLKEVAESSDDAHADWCLATIRTIVLPVLDEIGLALADAGW